VEVFVRSTADSFRRRESGVNYSRDARPERVALRRGTKTPGASRCTTCRRSHLIGPLDREAAQQVREVQVVVTAVARAGVQLSASGIGPVMRPAIPVAVGWFHKVRGIPRVSGCRGCYVSGSRCSLVATPRRRSSLRRSYGAGVRSSARPELSVKRFDERVLGWLPRLDEDQLDVAFQSPLLQSACDELRTVIDSKCRGIAELARHILELANDRDARVRKCWVDGEAVAAALIEQRKSSKRSTICIRRSETKLIVQISFGRVARRRGVPRTYFARLRRRRRDI
jgi:hypothetical protein